MEKEPHLALVLYPMFDTPLVSQSQTLLVEDSRST